MNIKLVKGYFHRDTGSAQLMARIVWSRTRSDDEANPVPLRRWQPPMTSLPTLQEQPAQIASSSYELELKLL